jgi:peptidylprolyl isomerase
MKNFYRQLTLAFVLSTSFMGAWAQDTKTQPQQEISKEDIQKISEAFGHFIGRNLNTPGINFDVEGVIRGIRNGVAGKPSPMSDKEYEEKMLMLQKIAFSKLSETNLKAANEFLTKNAKEKGIIEIEPGKLQYIILEQGNGPAVEATSHPMINYTGKYLDGTVFGSSTEAGGPITIPLDQTIPGFSKGITGMKEGEKRRLFMHPDLGYGTMGHLPPNSLLIFDIEVVKANAPKSSEHEDDEDDLLPLGLEDEKDEDEATENTHKKPATPTTKK